MKYILILGIFFYQIFSYSEKKETPKYQESVKNFIKKMTLNYKTQEINLENDIN